MKKIFIPLILLASMLLNACTLGGESMKDRDREIANARMDKLLETLQNQDKDGLKAMFSVNALAEAENFDERVNELFAYFQGTFVSYDDWSGPAVGAHIEYGEMIRQDMESTYDVKTSGKEYRCLIRDVTIDKEGPDNVGIWTLYIIKMEDDTDPNFAYRGDDKYTPGINIGIKNIIPEILPEEDDDF